MTLRLLVSHWQLAPGMLAVTGLCGLAYLQGVTRARGRWPRRRTVAFLAGLLCILIALQSGLDSYDDRLLSVHMVQHMILLMLAPLLLLAGQPLLLLIRALPRPQQRRAMARALRRVAQIAGPLPCLACFSLVVVLTHLPGFYDATLRHPVLHDGEHIAYVVAGLLLWWPLVGADPVPSRRLGGLGRLIYMLAAMPAMALVGAYLNRHASLVYPAYGPPGQALGINPLVDQAQAGAIMWVAGTLAMAVVGLWATVAGLIAEERRQRSRDARALQTGGIA